MNVAAGRDRQEAASRIPATRPAIAVETLREEIAGALATNKAELAPERLIVLYARLSRRAGVSHVHPHRFRHTFATMAIRSAAREIDVQHLLGHSTSSMVRRYTRTYDAELAAEAHASFSPAAQIIAKAV